jgi:hypothetical protein
MPTKQPILSHSIFFKRLARNVFFGILLMSTALFLGMLGYHHFENMSWTDAFVNASMILSGMGPVATLKTQGGKIFAGAYALFSGTLFLVTIAIVFAPLIHWFFRKFHIPQKGSE